MNALRLLLALFTILCCTTIAGASVQEGHAGVVFEKACVLEGEPHFSVSLDAPKSSPFPPGYRGGPGAAWKGEFVPDVTKAVNSNLPHAASRAVERGIFSSDKAAQSGLRALTNRIGKQGFPENSFLDPSKADRVLVPIRNGGLAVYQVGKNGTAKLKTVLIER